MIIDNQINLQTRYCFEPPLFIAKLHKKSCAVLELETLDLNEFLAPEIGNSCLIKVNTNDLISDGIAAGDMIVVNFSQVPKSGNFVIIKRWGKLRLAKMMTQKNRKYLLINRKRKIFNAKRIKGVVSHLIKSRG
jgi:SOS-response transcriptional repressor LexA